MFKKVKTCIADNLVILNQSIPILSVKYNEFVAKLNELDEAIIPTTQDIKMYAKQKNDIRMELSQKIRHLSAVLAAFALEQKDMELLNKANFAKSYVEKLKQTAFYTHCVNILNLCNPLLDSLIMYNLTSVNLKEVKDLTDAYIENIPLPEHHKIIKKLAVQKVNTLTDELDRIVSILDKLMIEVSFSNDDLYKEYRKNRVINVGGGGDA